MCIPSKVFNSKFTTTGNETLLQKTPVRAPMTEHLTLHKPKVDSIPNFLTEQYTHIIPKFRTHKQEFKVILS